LSNKKTEELYDNALPPTNTKEGILVDFVKKRWNAMAFNTTRTEFEERAQQVYWLRDTYEHGLKYMEQFNREVRFPTFNTIITDALDDLIDVLPETEYVALDEDMEENRRRAKLVTKARDDCANKGKKNGEVYEALRHADTEGINFRTAFSDAEFYLSGTCIWKKQSLVLGRSPYQWQHEPVLFGWKKKGKHLWYTGRKESTIWEFDKPRKNADHPTMKPVALLAYPIMNSSMSNTLVLDPFGGSGSTLIACEQTERSCYTIELDEKYCDVIIKRYSELIGSTDGITVQRDGLTYSYDELIPEELAENVG